MKATLEYIEQDNESVKTFWFRPQRPIKNVPGQFTELYLPHTNPDSRGQKRWFTIFSSPTEELFAITTKFADRSSTFKTALSQLEPGASVEFAEPMGDFILPKNKLLPLLFVAGGIGVTPFRSIIKWLHDTKERRNITLLYAARTEDDLLFTELFEDYDVHLVPIVSQPSATWSSKTGTLSPSTILDYVTSHKTHVYMSGPEPMVEALTKQVIEHGLPKHQVITDYFPGYK